MNETTENYRDLVKQLVLAESFVKLTLRGIVRGPAVPWRQITARPVQIKGVQQLQLSYFDAKQDITKNFRDAEAQAKLDEVLAISFSSIIVDTTDERVQVQLTKKGKAIIQRDKQVVAQPPQLGHNRIKQLPLPPDQSDPVLEQLGIMDRQGRVKREMQGKFGQINEFLKLLDHPGELETFDHTPLQILDCGSGSAYLTFALHHYLNDIRHIPAHVWGIDTNPHVIQKSLAASEELQCANLQFQQSSINMWEPPVTPDVVVALHACDTATDDAIAQGIRHGARLVVCVPCCHHDLNDQLASDVLRPVLRHGILKQRMADIVTDTFRALALRIMGYRTNVIEFISTEHTARNLMIRAVKATAPGDPQFVREYNDLKQFWQVTPRIEQVLGEGFVAIVDKIALN